MNTVQQVSFRPRTAVAVWAVLTLSLISAGCGSRRSPPAERVESEPAAAEDAEPQDAAAEMTPEPTDDPLPAEGFAEPSEPPDAIDPADLRAVGPQDARRGSSIQGGGIITEPLRQHFLLQHRIVFEISLKQAEQLYQGEHGRMPESHEEYMREIVEKNNIELPELQPGWDYYYDATDGELKQRKVE